MMTANNDQAIINAIARQNELWHEMASLSEHGDNDSQSTYDELFAKIYALDEIIASTCSNSLAGAKAKVKWLLSTENYNDGDFDGSNGDVLHSLFDDVLALETQLM